MSRRAPVRAYERAKRGADVVGAVVGLAVTMPLQAVVALLVRCRLGPPVLFRQARPGRHGVPFELVKFRTMTAACSPGALDEDRLVPLGRLLRATSLDELPTLWNVLRGDMSFVGPRPLLMDYLDLYSAEHARRHDVRPGITGLAQVSGRNELAWHDRFVKDLEYVDARGPCLDLSILVRTLATVITGRGVQGAGGATMSRYTGPSTLSST